MRNVIFLLSLSLAANGPAQASHDYRPGKQWPGYVAAERFHDSAVHYHRQLKYDGAPRHAVKQSRSLARQARDLKRMVYRGRDGRSMHRQFQRMSHTLDSLQYGHHDYRSRQHGRDRHHRGSRQLGQLNRSFERLGYALFSGRGYRAQDRDAYWGHYRVPRDRHSSRHDERYESSR